MKTINWQRNGEKLSRSVFLTNPYFFTLIINSSEEALKASFFVSKSEILYDNYHFNFNILSLLLNNEKRVYYE